RHAVTATPAGRRKLLLFAAGCYRRFWPLLNDPRCRLLVEALEGDADGLATRRGLGRGGGRGGRAGGGRFPGARGGRGGGGGGPGPARRADLRPAGDAPLPAHGPEGASVGLGGGADGHPGAFGRRAVARVAGARAALAGGPGARPVLAVRPAPRGGPLAGVGRG